MSDCGITAALERIPGPDKNKRSFIKRCVKENMSSPAVISLRIFDSRFRSLNHNEPLSDMKVIGSPLHRWLRLHSVLPNACNPTTVTLSPEPEEVGTAVVEHRLCGQAAKKVCPSLLWCSTEVVSCL